MNLTTVVDVEQAVTRHYAESVFLASFLPVDCRSVIDVGSGAGFPGFPIAAVRPDLEVVLLESIGKKCIFLKEASRGVANVEVVNARAESFDRSADCIVSRAVAPKEVAALIPRLTSRALMLIAGSDVRQPWRALSPLPWNSSSVVVEFHVEHESLVP
jgi:16S rRNA (guanine(527)-N(7))-methyltransferase RsmG